jgi:hypothetical protein
MKTRSGPRHPERVSGSNPPPPCRSIFQRNDATSAERSSPARAWWTRGLARDIGRSSASRNRRVVASSPFQMSSHGSSRKAARHLCRPAPALPPKQQLHFSGVPVLYTVSVTLSTQTNRSGKSYFQPRSTADFRGWSGMLLEPTNPIFMRPGKFSGRKIVLPEVRPAGARCPSRDRARHPEPRRPGLGRG